MVQEAIRNLQLGWTEKPVQANCVIAALESAFPAPATTEERNLRDRLARDKGIRLEPYEYLAKTPEGERALCKANLIFEFRSIGSFFRQLSFHNTPLGKLLRKYDMTQQVIDGLEIDQTIVPGKIVLIVQASRKEKWHMMHARRMSDRTIVSGNDNNERIVLRPNGKYLIYVFTKKTKITSN